MKTFIIRSRKDWTNMLSELWSGEECHVILDFPQKRNPGDIIMQVCLVSPEYYDASD